MAEPAPRNRTPLRTLPRPIAPIWSRAWRGFPAKLGPLIGRERELAALVTLLGDAHHRLITVTGPGGVGKSRLAVEAAERVDEAFPDGAAFVALAAIDDPSLILPAIAQTLEVRESPGRPLHETLVGALRERRLLLLLDNLEHLVGAALTADLSVLLQGCPRLTILATSRAPLSLHHEQRFATLPLALPANAEDDDLQALSQADAVALFLACASEVQPGFALDRANAPAIAEICRRLDGLPLAIELAAAWVRVLSPSTLLARLEPRLPLLSGGPSDQPSRLRSMRDAIAWSYDLLTPAEQTLFRRLAIFSGGFTLEAAEGVGGWRSEPPTPVLELLAALVDKCLVQQVDAVGPIPRFAMLETVREYGRERLSEHGEAGSIAAAHAAYYAQLAERIEPESLGPNERSWYAVLNAELGNVRAALAWSLAHDPTVTLRIAAPLWVYWSVHHLAEGRGWLQAGLVQASSADGLLRAKGLTTEGALGCLMGDFAASEQSVVEAAALAKAAGDPAVEARARWIIGADQLSSGRLESALEELDQALRLFAHATSSADLTRTPYARSSHGAVNFMRGEVAQGTADYERALVEVREAGSADVAIVIMCDYAGWLITLGETVRARQLLQEALASAAGAPILLLPLMALLGLALVAAMEGDAATAAHRLGAVEAMRRRSGLFLPAYYQDRLDQATALAKQALGAAAYEAAWEDGQGNTDAVIGAALPRLENDDQQGNSAQLLERGLSPREREVLELLTTGHTDREIAAALFISMRTASSHVSSILQKLNAVSRAEAAVVAVRAGLA